MARARLYIRRSDDDQSAYSPEAQERQNRLWCELHGHEVVDVYIDDDLSGTKEQRAEFQRLLQDIRSDPGSIVVVHKIDRFARDAELTLRTIKEFDSHNVTLVSVMEQMDFSTPFGRMMLTNLAAWAEYYSRNLSTETKKGLREKAAQGQWIGPVPLGYTRVYALASDGQRILGSDQLQFTPDVETVRLMYRLYATGSHSDSSVAEVCNARGLTVIDIHTGKRKPFSTDTVRHILMSKAYIGVVTCDGIEYEGKHPPAVDRSLWEQCQVVRRRRTFRPLDGGVVQGRGGKVPARGQGGLLSEIAFCGRCGARLHWQYSGNPKYRQGYYRCSAYRKFGSSACSRALIPARNVHPQLLDALHKLTLPKKLQEAVLAEVKRRAQSSSPQKPTQATVQEQLRRLGVAYRLGDIDDDAYLRERERLRGLLGEETTPLPAVLDLQQAIAMLDDLPSLLDAASEDELRGIVQQIFVTIWLEPKKITAAKATKNYALLLNQQQSVVGGTTSAGVEPTTFGSGGQRSIH
jgi:site-specific DNA recombinase